MSDVEERKVGPLTVRIDRLICVGFGDCIDVSAESFALDADGIAVFQDSVDSVAPQDLIEACRACPVDALTVLDPDGGQVVP